MAPTSDPKPNGKYPIPKGTPIHRLLVYLAKAVADRLLAISQNSESSGQDNGPSAGEQR